MISGPGGAAAIEAGANPAQGVRATSDAPERVVIGGPFNLASVGSFQAGDGWNRATDRARRSAQIADGEKLNYERPARACWSCLSETVPNREQSASRVKRVLLVSARRNHERFARGNYAVAGAADIRRRPGR